MTSPDNGDSSRYRRLMQEALMELESLQKRLDRLRRASSEPIAVVGLACRFPAGANSPGQYWKLLADGVDAVAEIPPQRWDVQAYYDPDPAAPGKVYCRNAALVDQPLVETFSPEFFGIAPREAQAMDPQQRMLLEVCWEAIEDAALPADHVRGSRTGLFVGSCTDDYLHLFNNLVDPAAIEGYSSLGTARCITAGRVSYMLGLRGPAIQIDTACSSSLVAVHQACASLRSSDCDMALAGGVNLQLSPVWTIGLCKLRALAPDGRCKTFDAAADGFGRGEGCGVLVLKRLSDALEAGDPIRAIVRGTAVNHDGRSAGLTVPNQSAQEDLLRQALQAAKVQPEQIGYIEAHGTGTSLGDPVEMGALASVFGQRQQPLWVGSVKTNIGHLEAAAGVAGLIKVILALQHEAIPPHLHFNRPNPHIAWDDLPVQVPTKLTPWSRGQHSRLAGVSSFGFSGTNAHVILEEPPLRPQIPAPQRPCHLLVLSAKTPEALQQVAHRYAARLSQQPPLELADVCHTAALGRSHLPHRLAVLAETPDRVAHLLRSPLASAPADGMWVGQAKSQGNPTEWPQDAQIDPNRWQALLAQAADRYVRGLGVDWAALFKDTAAQKVALPTYPFQRQRYWPQNPPSTVTATATATPALRTARPGHPLLGRRISVAVAAKSVLFERSMSASDPAYLADHCLGESAVVPATALLEIALSAAHELAPNTAAALADVTFERAITLPPGQHRVVQTVLTPDGDGHRFEIFSRAADAPDQTLPQWTRHASGKLIAASAPHPPTSLEGLRQRCDQQVPAQHIYDRIAAQGLHYGPAFRCLQQAWRNTADALGLVAAPDDPPLDVDAYRFHPALLDACLHVIAAMSETDVPTTLVPVAVRRADVFGRPSPQLWTHASLHASSSTGPSVDFTLDVDIFDADQQPIARLEGLRFRGVEASFLTAHCEPESEIPPRAPWRRRLVDSPPASRQRLLVSLLRAEVATVLGWESADRVGPKQNLFDVGMDSLTSLELQVRLQKNLGCPLPLSLAFDYPNVQALAAYIMRQFPTEDEAADSVAPSDDAQRLAAMSDEQVQALLSEKYKHVLEDSSDPGRSHP